MTYAYKVARERGKSSVLMPGYSALFTCICNAVCYSFV